MSFLEQSFSVKFEYKIHFTKSLFHTDNPTFTDFFKSNPTDVLRKIFFVLDQGVADAHPDLVSAIRTYFDHQQEVQLISEILIIQGGEASKNDTGLFDRLVEAVDEYGIDRHCRDRWWCRA